MVKPHTSARPVRLSEQTSHEKVTKKKVVPAVPKQLYRPWVWEESTKEHDVVKMLSEASQFLGPGPLAVNILRHAAIFHPDYPGATQWGDHPDMPARLEAARILIKVMEPGHAWVLNQVSENEKRGYDKWQNFGGSNRVITPDLPLEKDAVALYAGMIACYYAVATQYDRVPTWGLGTLIEQMSAEHPGCDETVCAKEASCKVCAGKANRQRWTNPSEADDINSPVDEDGEFFAPYGEEGPSHSSVESSRPTESTRSAPAAATAPPTMAQPQLNTACCCPHIKSLENKLDKLESIIQMNLIPNITQMVRTIGELWASSNSGGPPQLAAASAMLDSVSGNISVAGPSQSNKTPAQLEVEQMYIRAGLPVPPGL